MLILSILFLWWFEAIFNFNLYDCDEMWLRWITDLYNYGLNYGLHIESLTCGNTQFPSLWHLLFLYSTECYWVAPESALLVSDRQRSTFYLYHISHRPRGYLKTRSAFWHPNSALFAGLFACTENHSGTGKETSGNACGFHLLVTEHILLLSL